MCGRSIWCDVQEKHDEQVEYGWLTRTVPLSKSTTTTSSRDDDLSADANRLGACKPTRKGMGAAR